VVISGLSPRKYEWNSQGRSCGIWWTKWLIGLVVPQQIRHTHCKLLLNQYSKFMHLQVRTQQAVLRLQHQITRKTLLNLVYVRGAVMILRSKCLCGAHIGQSSLNAVLCQCQIQFAPVCFWNYMHRYIRYWHTDFKISTSLFLNKSNSQ